jgi:ABC-type amino acid transport substrate-binding protein
MGINMVKSHYRGLLLGLFYLFLTAPFQASAEPRPIKIAVPHLSQLVQKNADNQWGGPLIDLLNEMSRTSGYQMDVHVVPFKRAVIMTNEGAADFGIFMESPIRNKTALPIHKLGNATFVIISLKDAPITHLSQLKGKTVARILGGTEIKSLAGIEDLTYYPFKSHAEGARLLLARRVDALLTADFRVIDAFDNLNLSPEDIAPPLSVEDRELWLYWSWKSDLDFKHVRRIKHDTPDNLLSKDSLSLLKDYVEQNNNSSD